MQRGCSILYVLTVILMLTATVGAPATAWAERWWGSGNVCVDLDSVHIITIRGTRYVAFQQRLCEGSGTLWWAVADSDCKTARGKDAETVELYVFDADARQWRSEGDYFGYDPSGDTSQYTNAGVACNWAHPGLY